ncbi:hypothetical protein CHS0354_036438 [Potamilus streckersoni]|uniref:Uncharacterized protein n=1 Tax=Potamilus streckersoni TaxID=2493646 RepID=A0AAE0SX44_9BIVA|nr:hypothetical protein CHS0354_036438 [Potamilus streckersoni]
MSGKFKEDRNKLDIGLADNRNKDMNKYDFNMSNSPVSKGFSAYKPDESLEMTPVKYKRGRSKNAVHALESEFSKAGEMNVSHWKSDVLPRILSKRPVEAIPASKPNHTEGSYILTLFKNKEKDKALILAELRTRVENPFEVEFYCIDHELFLTAKDCMSSHRYCKDVIPVLEWAKRNRETRELTKLEKVMEQYANFGSLMSEERIEQRDILEMKKSLFLEELYQYQEDTIAHLLTLQDEFVKKFDEMHENNIQILSGQIKRTSLVRTGASAALNKIQTLIKQVGDRNEEYIKTKRELQLKSPVYEEILHRDFLTFKRLDYEMKYDPAFEAITEDVQKLAYIAEKPQTSKLPPFLSQSKEVSFAKRHVKDLDRMFCKHPKDNSDCCISGCCYINDGKILLADWNNRCVKLLDKCCNVVSRVALPQSPWDVTQIDDKKVAVTVPGEKTVFVLTYTKNLQIFGSFQTQCECWGITFVEDKFVVTCDPSSATPNLKFFSLKGDEMKCIMNDTNGPPLFKCPNYVITNQIKTLILVSDCGSNVITCLNLEGEVKFRYRHEKLDYPTGMSTDCQGNVYICGKESHNIHVITEEGMFSRILLSNDNILHGPRCISFETNGERFIVSDISGDNYNEIIQAKML